jgi:Thioredoxin like C-terminal domain
VSVEGIGVEAAADWDNLETPETYLGYARSDPFASPHGSTFTERRVYELPQRLRFNHWALAGEWTIEPENVVLEQAGGSIAFRFHARDAPTRTRARSGPPADAQDDVPRARRQGVRVHVRVTAARPLSR